MQEYTLNPITHTHTLSLSLSRKADILCLVHVPNHKIARSLSFLLRLSLSLSLSVFLYRSPPAWVRKADAARRGLLALFSPRRKEKQRTGRWHSGTV